MKKAIKKTVSSAKAIPKKETTDSGFQNAFNERWLYLILGFLAFIVYANSLSNGYSYNDELNVLSNPGIKSITQVFSISSNTDFFSATSFPLTKFIFFLEYTVLGFKPFTSHLINILAYAGVVLLVFKLLKTHFFINDLWLPFFITITFSLHPIHTEVVNNIQNRGEILFFLFSVLTIDLFLTAIENNMLKHAVFAIVAALCALLCSPFSVISMLSLLAFVLVVKPHKMRSVAGILLLLTIAVSIIYFIFTYKKTLTTVYFVENPIVSFSSFINKFSLVCMSALIYLKLLVFPVKLSFYYGYNTIAINKIIVFFAIVIHVFLLVLSTILYSKNRLISFFILFYFTAIFLYVSLLFPYPGIISERAMLFASLPFCILVIYLISNFIGDASVPVFNRSKFWYVFIALNCMYVVRSIARNMDWKDTLSIMTNDVQHLENSANANYLLADQSILAYNADGNQERKITAETALKKSLTVLPDYSLALSKLGYLYSVINNDTLQGLDYMQQAYKVNPNDARIVSNLALGYNKVANPDSALSLFNRAIELDPNDRWSYFYAAQLLFDNGKQNEAFVKNAQLKEKFPENELAYLNYGTFYFRAGKEDSSITNFELAVKYGSKNKQLINHLFSVFTKKGDMDKAAYYQSLLNEE